MVLAPEPSDAPEAAIALRRKGVQRASSQKPEGGKSPMSSNVDLNTES